MAGPRIFWITPEEKVIPSLREGKSLIPGAELSLHLTRSLRCQVGDRFSFCDPESGQAFIGEVDNLSPFSLSLVPLITSPAFPGQSRQCHFSLAIAPIKGDFLSQTLSQAAMCGIDRLIWLSTDRGVVRWDKEEFLRKKGRMEAIIREKSQLAGRSTRMALEAPQTLSDLAAVPEISFLFFDETEALWNEGRPWWEGVISEYARKEGKNELVALIGPEGGWSARERDLLKSLPSQRLFSGTLGPLILSAEAAILAVTSLLGIASGYYRTLSSLEQE
jgi:16S rRNA (uracil1498-N3)-methyltransferase